MVGAKGSEIEVIILGDSRGLTDGTAVIRVNRV